MPVPEIASALTALKAIAGVAREAQKIEITAQVIELQQTLLGLLAENTEMATKIALLEASLRERDSKSQKQESFVFERNAYWIVGTDQHVGPFCSRCFDVDEKAVRMHPQNDGVYRCPGCKTYTNVDPSERVRTTGPIRVARKGWITGH